MSDAPLPVSPIAGDPSVLHTSKGPPLILVFLASGLLVGAVLTILLLRHVYPNRFASRTPPVRPRKRNGALGERPRLWDVYCYSDAESGSGRWTSLLVRYRRLTRDGPVAHSPPTGRRMSPVLLVNSDPRPAPNFTAASSRLSPRTRRARDRAGARHPRLPPTSLAMGRLAPAHDLASSPLMCARRCGAGAGGQGRSAVDGTIADRCHSRYAFETVIPARIMVMSGEDANVRP